MAGPGPGWLTNTELGASVIKTIGERELLEVALAAIIGGGIGADVLIHNAGSPGKVPDAVFGFVLDSLGSAEQTVGTPIFQAFLKTALGVNLSGSSGQEAPAVRMIERAIGFAAGLPLVTGPVAGFLETKYGNHAPKELGRAIRAIPHEIGLSFFLGTTLASIFEKATSGPIGEAIQEQTRPTRLAWSQIARLLKAKQIDAATATDYLKKAGFRDQDIPLLEKLDNNLLSVTQVQTLHEVGWMSDGIARDYLDRLGFEPADRDAVMQIFAHNAASEGATSFRTVARNAFRDSYLSQDAYRSMLKQVETPPESIDLLVAGVELERDAGRIHLSIAEIKDLWLHQHIDNNEVRQRLATLGMSDSDIADLLLVWGDARKVARSGIGTPKVLGYLIGGVIDKPTALAHLIANGMNAKDAQFLVDHPTTHPQVTVKPISPATVVAAYKDDVITIDAATAILKTLDLNPTEASLLLANATAVITKGKKPKHPTKTLTENHVLEFVKYGLATPSWAERELETLGYAAGDASALVMLELAKLSPDNIKTFGWQILN